MYPVVSISTIKDPHLGQNDIKILHCQELYLWVKRYSKQIHKDPGVSGKEPVGSTVPVSTL